MILSIDVGKKNLAVCALDPGPTPAESRVAHWAVLTTSTACAAVAKTMRDFLTFDYDEVVIERQPGRNPTMKRLEALLEMFFTLRDKKVCLIDPKHKLAFAAATPWFPSDQPDTWTYAARKKLSVQTTAAFLRATPHNAAASRIFGASKKKDDLGDSMLQALAFAFFVRPKKRARVEHPTTSDSVHPDSVHPESAHLDSVYLDSAKSKVVVARKPGPRQLETGQFSKSNIKWMLRDCCDAAEAIRDDNKLRAAVLRHFGTVEQCMTSLCLV